MTISSCWKSLKTHSSEICPRTLTKAAIYISTQSERILLLIMLLARLVLLGTALAVASPLTSSKGQHHVTPTAIVSNGTYSGVHSVEFNQDFFLGVPFAQSPTADLRFRNPKPLNTSWDGIRPATSYSAECVGYGVSPPHMKLCFAVGADAS